MTDMDGSVDTPSSKITAAGDTVVAEMMHNEEYKQLFKSLIKEAVKEENDEYRQTIHELEAKVTINYRMIMKK